MSCETFLNLDVQNYNFNSLLNNTEIKSLALNFYEIDNSILNVINQLDNLETITLNFCTIKPESIKLKNRFKQIILTYTNIDIKCFEGKEELLELEILNDKDDYVEIDIKDLQEFQKIESLRIYNCKVKNSVYINRFKNLKKLFLDGSLVDANNFCEILNKQVKFIYRNEYLFD